jgi:DNA helicase HerA-like ATPase
LEYLDRGTNVILEFGRYDDFTAYILVANLLTRRIHAQYRERKETALGEETAPPRPLVITIEEAHRFLNPQLSNQTIFGIIAREMRKYNVTLLTVDQRPSGIDAEVMSQLGTKITCLLDNEQDVDSVLSGASGKSELKTVLSRLETKQQALVFGHAVPMPVPIKVREYGRDYRQFGSADISAIRSRSSELREGAAKQSHEAEDLWTE